MSDMEKQIIQRTFPDTPEKFIPLAEEAADCLTKVLRELAALEDRSFAQYTRLCRKGRLVEFHDGTRTEFTDIQAWKDACRVRFAAFLDPWCTQGLISGRRDCRHADHFPSSFNCLNTGCTLAVTVKSGKKGEALVIPQEGPVPFDLSNADVRYLVEDMRGSGHSAQFHDYFQKFRFLLKREEASWRIDAVYCDSSHGNRWRRETTF